MIVSDYLTKLGTKFNIDYLPGRSTWWEFTLPGATLNPDDLRYTLKKLTDNGAVSVKTDAPTKQGHALPEWQQRERERAKAKRDEKRRKRVEWVASCRATGHMEFSVFGKENCPTVEATLIRLGQPFKVRPGGAYWVYTVNCPMLDADFQAWLDKAFPGIVCKVVRL
jgi:hypothetical protein